MTRSTELTELGEVLWEVLGSEVGGLITRDALEGQLRELLYGRRALAACIAMGVTTPLEVSLALLDRVATWAAAQVGRSHDDVMDLYPPGLEVRVEGVLQRLAPAVPRAPDELSRYPIIINPWPEWQALADGAHRRTFRFELEQAIAPATNLDEVLREGDVLDVHAQRGDAPYVLMVETTTRDNARSDELFFFAFYRLFVRIEERVGRILTIEGQARALWRPFRGSREAFTMGRTLMTEMPAMSAYLEGLGAVHLYLVEYRMTHGYARVLLTAPTGFTKLAHVYLRDCHFIAGPTSGGPWTCSLRAGNDDEAPSPFVFEAGPFQIKALNVQVEAASAKAPRS